MTRTLNPTPTYHQREPDLAHHPHFASTVAGSPKHALQHQHQHPSRYILLALSAPHSQALQRAPTTQTYSAIGNHLAAVDAPFLITKGEYCAQAKVMHWRIQRCSCTPRDIYESSHKAHLEIVGLPTACRLPLVCAWSMCKLFRRASSSACGLRRLAACPSTRDLRAPPLLSPSSSIY